MAAVGTLALGITVGLVVTRAPVKGMIDWEGPRLEQEVINKIVISVKKAALNVLAFMVFLSNVDPKYADKRCAKSLQMRVNL